MKECDIFRGGEGVKTYSDPYIFSGGPDSQSQTPNPRIYAPEREPMSDKSQRNQSQALPTKV